MIMAYDPQAKGRYIFHKGLEETEQSFCATLHRMMLNAMSPSLGLALLAYAPLNCLWL